jgi:hypothetical protein
MKFSSKLNDDTSYSLKTKNKRGRINGGGNTYGNAIFNLKKKEETSSKSLDTYMKNSEKHVLDGCRIPHEHVGLIRFEKNITIIDRTCNVQNKAWD